MKILIQYEASWRNSFLDADNNSKIDRKGRTYVASSSNLNSRDSKLAEKSFISRSVSIDTVMGILNRLIGDQRKLHQSRSSTDYYFNDLEDKVTFIDQPKCICDEVVFIRNICGGKDRKGATDRNGYSGYIRPNHLFTSDYSPYLWAILKAPLSDLINYICDRISFEEHLDECYPFAVLELINSIKSIKPVLPDDDMEACLNILSNKYPKERYKESNGKVKLERIYCAGLYIHLEKLIWKFPSIKNALTDRGTIIGFSKRGFNGERDFLSPMASSGKKRTYGNPYIQERFLKGQGKVRSSLTKVSGELRINIEVDKKRAEELFKMIEFAGVSSFYLGKKGLAYVSDIRI